MPNYQGVWSLSTQMQNASAWPLGPLTGDIGLFQRGTTIEHINIASTGNATDFGDRTANLYECGAVSSSTRACWGGGQSYQVTIDYVTIANLGNATDFGDLSVGRAGLDGCGSSTRGIFSDGTTNAGSATAANVIDYITIASTGNATDFGDSLDTIVAGVSISNGHGGL